MRGLDSIFRHFFAVVRLFALRQRLPLRAVESIFFKMGLNSSYGIGRYYVVARLKAVKRGRIGNLTHIYLGKNPVLGLLALVYLG